MPCLCNVYKLLHVQISDNGTQDIFEKIVSVAAFVDSWRNLEKINNTNTSSTKSRGVKSEFNHIPPGLFALGDGVERVEMRSASKLQ